MYLRKVAQEQKRKAGPFKVFDFDGNAAPLVRRAKAAGLTGSDIEIYTYLPKGGDKIGEGAFRPRGQGRDIFLQFIKDFNVLEDMVDPKTGEWLEGQAGPIGIAIDSVTTLQDVILDHVLCSVGHELGAEKTDARADFGKQMQKTTEIIDCAKALPCVCVFNAHERAQTAENGGVIGIDPLFTGEQYAASIGKVFSVVLYSQVKGDKYIWRTRPQALVKMGGSRMRDDLPTEIPQDYSLVL
jgi:hypothetical protein